MGAPQAPGKGELEATTSLALLPLMIALAIEVVELLDGDRSSQRLASALI